MKLKKSEMPDWQKKLDAYSGIRLRLWATGRERPPSNLSGFIMFDSNNDEHCKKLEVLGVELHSKIGNFINTANLPLHNLQAICECDFVKSIEFSKPLKMLHSPKLPEDRKGREKWFQDRQ